MHNVLPHLLGHAYIALGEFDPQKDKIISNSSAGLSLTDTGAARIEDVASTALDSVSLLGIEVEKTSSDNSAASWDIGDAAAPSTLALTEDWLILADSPETASSIIELQNNQGNNLMRNEEFAKAIRLVGAPQRFILHVDFRKAFPRWHDNLDIPTTTGALTHEAIGTLTLSDTERLMEITEYRGLLTLFPNE